ncbi:polyphosphate kinase 2 family protein [Azospirillum doebereinerae]|uniref:Polyphosphate kinase n=1 Tax=Azospirillum doebereinerae TaxID=92933 RepID=A0A433IZF4_9PROT|nr:PPK2 family polyphosphate kinase [Azospirillum doebereinerae]MCG5242986.1 polyphosphate kinase [Azospirillum doebereinerae]RUQ60440.1 polyphosphate kinase [Azospirillum doebereinerae]
MAGKSAKIQKIRLDKLDQTGTRIDTAEDYDRRLGKLQKELLHIQQTYWHEKRRAIIVFEGWDAGGKGGAIRRMTEPLDPRGFHVWPISAPTAEEQGKHYLYRFWTKLPAAGTFAVFDRSWYGRVLVERVEKLATKDQWKRAYDEINEFERLMTDDGVRVVKLFLHITPEEQLERFRERLSNPYKRWKLTEEDLRNRSRWDDYVKAAETMFEKTSTPHAPWHAIPANSKWFARLQVLEIVTRTLKEGVDITPPPINGNVARIAAEVLGVPAGTGG